MITWSGLIAKLIEFMATKLIGKQIDIAMDKKSRSAKAFLNLYNAFIDVERTLAQSILILEEACLRRKPVVFSKKIVNFAPEIKAASVSFFQALSSTVNTIHFLDPKLSGLLRLVLAPKPFFLTSLGTLLSDATFDIDFSGLHPFRVITYTIPTVCQDDIDLETYYDTIEMGSDVSNSRDSIVSAQEALVEVIKKAVVRNRISSNDFDKVCGLCEELKTHQRNVAQAREALRVFISRSFSIDDLMFQ